MNHGERSAPSVTPQHNLLIGQEFPRKGGRPTLLHRDRQERRERCTDKNFLLTQKKDSESFLSPPRGFLIMGFHVNKSMSTSTR